MKKGKKQMMRCFCAVLALVVLLLTGCAREDTPLFVHKGDTMDIYATAAEDVLSSYEPRTAQEQINPFSALRSGGAVECFEVQAASAVREGVGSYWYPQCLATVVLAVDRDQTGFPVDSWQSLLDCDLDVAWNTAEKSADEFLAASLAYGLEGEDCTAQAAYDFLEKLNGAGHFFEDDWEKPVMVLLDYQAVSMMEAGRNLEIIVPKEGTLSSALGLLSAERLTIPRDGDLLRAGLRLVDGRCTNPLYPEDAAYRPAIPAEADAQFMADAADLRRDIRRQVQHTRLYSSADGREHVMFALIGIILVLLWTASALHRSVRSTVQRAIRWIAILIVGWLLLRLFKYQLPQGIWLNRYCWYGYYIFQLGLPVVMLYLTTVVDRSDTDTGQTRFLRLVSAAYPILVAFVMTNDLHQLVFSFPEGNWDEYTYRTGYFVVYGYCIVTFLLSIVLLIRKSWQSPLKLGWLPPAAVAVLIVAYATGYVLEVPLARDSDYTMTVCMFAVLFMETALHTGLIPANTHYGLLFSASPLDMQILDQKGRTVLASASASRLEPVLRVQLCAQPSVTMERGENTLLFGQTIRGGTVVWEEDMRAINSLRRRVSDSVERLEAANTLLRQEGRIRRRRLDSEARADLFASLEDEIGERTEELAEAIDVLNHAEDRGRQTAYITLLLCYIKRRCNLFFLAREGKNMPGDELAMYLDELSEFAVYAGISVLTRCAVSEDIDIRRATLCYDFCFTVMAWAVQKSRATLLGQIEDRRDALEVRILSSESAGTLEFSTAFLHIAKENGGTVTQKEIDEETGIYLTFSKGEKNDE